MEQSSDRVVDSPQEIADLFVDTFNSVSVEEVPIRLGLYWVLNGKMPDAVIPVDKTSNVFQIRDIYSAKGLDQAHPRVLKACAPNLPYLPHIISSGLFPEARLLSP